MPPDRHRKALYVLEQDAFPLVYGADERAELAQLAHFYARPQTCESIAANPAVLADAEVIFSGWGAPTMDAAFLRAAPRLQAVFYAAGSTHYFTSEAFWERGIVLSCAVEANAKPVAEYTLGVILLALKNFWSFSDMAKKGAGWGLPYRDVPGAFRSTVALIGCGAIARRVIALLSAFELSCIVYDPYLSEPEAAALGVARCSLAEAFENGNVVSLHAPCRPETFGMITGELLSRMKRGATFVNTARGRLVREAEMMAVLERRPDLQAVLDVTDPEPPTPDSLLLKLPNVIVTPHIAGSLGRECGRMGRYMVEEFHRYLAGAPLRWQVTRQLAARAA